MRQYGINGYPECGPAAEDTHLALAMKRVYKGLAGSVELRKHLEADHDQSSGLKRCVGLVRVIVIVDVYFD